jgi:Fic family protein
MDFYDHPSSMDPLLPSSGQTEMEGLAVSLLAGTARLSERLRPHTRTRIAALVRSMNGYYSNLIEGHRMKPHDIERALHNDFSEKKDVREKQWLHVAHLQALEILEAENPKIDDLLTTEFILRIHEEFCKRLPREMLIQKGLEGKEYEVVPGELRDHNVSVGRHVPPDYQSLPKFLDRFTGFYREEAKKTPTASIVAAMAAHHRLAWIHPFADGNGRVARLLTHLWLRSAGADGGGMWTLSRGLARRVEEYRSAMDNADEKRHNDFDGRGPRSDAALRAFCRFMFDAALDQVAFMGHLIDIGEFENRLMAICRQQEAEGKIAEGSLALVKQVFLEDELRRGDAPRILGVSPRTAQTVIARLLAEGWLLSPSPKGMLMLGFPNSALPFLFPNLYPSRAPEE